MSLKTAAFLAMIGTTLLFVLAAADFFSALIGTVTNVVPVVKLLTSFIQLFAVLGLVLFFYAYHKKES